MNTQHKAELNHFFVTVFNNILTWEEQTLASCGAPGLSVKEFHVLEAIDRLQAKSKNTMTNVARALSISVGALTTAISVLVRKGYVSRQQSQEDRRIINIFLTDKGQAANELHHRFHEEMIEEVVSGLDGPQLDMLILSLKHLSRFFMNKMTAKTEKE